MGFHRGPALIPQLHRQARLILYSFGKYPAKLSSGALGAIHILGKSDNDFPYIIFLYNFLDLCNGLICIAAVDHRCAANDRTQQVRNGDAGSCIAIVNSHNSFHDYRSPHILLIFPIIVQDHQKIKKIFVDFEDPLW